MKKSDLRRLITQYKTENAKKIEEFLESEKIKSLDDQDNISFDTFLNYLKDKKVSIDTAFLNKDAKSIELFTDFLKLSSKPILHRDVMRGVLAKLLDPKDMANLASTSSYLYTETKRPEYQRNEYWVNKIIELSHDRENAGRVQNIVKLGVIKNFKKLYFKIKNTNKTYICNGIFSNINNLLVISGEHDAIQYIIQNNLNTSDFSDAEKFNVFFHYMMASGSVFCLEKFLSLKNDNIQRGIQEIFTQRLLDLRFVVISGSIPMLEKVLSLRNQKGASVFKLLDNQASDLFSHAMSSASISMVNKILSLKNEKGEEADFLLTDGNGYGLLHYAIKDDSLLMLEKILSLKNNQGQSINILMENIVGENLLHYAADVGSLSMLEKILSLKNSDRKSIDILKINDYGKTILDIALQRKSEVIIEKILSLKNTQGDYLFNKISDNSFNKLLKYIISIESVSLFERALSFKTEKGGEIDFIGLRLNSSDQTPHIISWLYYIVSQGSIPLLERALAYKNKNGKSFDICENFEDRNLLYAAVESSSMSMLKKVVSLINNQGKTINFFRGIYRCDIFNNILIHAAKLNVPLEVFNFLRILLYDANPNAKIFFSQFVAKEYISAFSIPIEDLLANREKIENFSYEKKEKKEIKVDKKEIKLATSNFLFSTPREKDTFIALPMVDILKSIDELKEVKKDKNEKNDEKKVLIELISDLPNKEGIRCLSLNELINCKRLLSAVMESCNEQLKPLLSRIFALIDEKYKPDETFDVILDLPSRVVPNKSKKVDEKKESERRNIFAKTCEEIVALLKKIEIKDDSYQNLYSLAERVLLIRVNYAEDKGGFSNIASGSKEKPDKSERLTDIELSLQKIIKAYSGPSDLMLRYTEMTNALEELEKSATSTSRSWIGKDDFTKEIIKAEEFCKGQIEYLKSLTMQKFKKPSSTSTT